MTPRENSVKHLANFYTVIAGLALTTAVYALINEKTEVLIFTRPTFLLCVAFLVTLLPFYQGALRHLDVTYVEVERGAPGPKAGAFLADFALLFAESCLFIILASSITDPVTFTLSFIALLVFDSIWGFLANVAFSGPKKGAQELMWAKINFVTLLIIFSFMYFEGLIHNLRGPINAMTISVVILVISLARTIFDYWLSWKHGYYSWPDDGS